MSAKFCSACGSLISNSECSNKRCPDKIAKAIVNSKRYADVVEAVALELLISRKEAEELLKRNQNTPYTR